MYCFVYVVCIALLLHPTQPAYESARNYSRSDCNVYELRNFSTAFPRIQEVLNNANLTDVTSASLTCDDASGSSSITFTEQTIPNYDDFITMVIMNIYRYGSPVLIVVGSVGNSIAAVTLQSRLFNKTPSTRFILTTLTLCEIALLFIPFLRIYLETGYDIRIRGFSSFGCKLHCFLTYITRHLSSWTLILLTLERTISVYFPFRCKQICSHRNVVCAWITLFVAMFAMNCHLFWSVDISDFYSFPSCSPVSSWVWFVMGPWTLINISLTDLVPFALVITGNILIISKTIRAQRARSNTMQGSLGANNKDKAKLVTSTTYILILVSAVFLLTHAPNVSYFIASFFGFFSQQTYEHNPALQLFYAGENFVYYINCAVEFILYFFGGRKFRAAFMDMFGIRKADTH